MAERKGIDNTVPNHYSGAKLTNEAEGVKNDNKSMVHDEETHGKSEVINEKTQIDEVKGPSVVQRVKEEVEAVADALVEAVHPKK